MLLLSSPDDHILFFSELTPGMKFSGEVCNKYQYYENSFTQVIDIDDNSYTNQYDHEHLSQNLNKTKSTLKNGERNNEVKCEESLDETDGEINGGQNSYENQNCRDENSSENQHYGKSLHHFNDKTTPEIISTHARTISLKLKTWP